ncbi:MAG TPA: N-acetyl-gamma-glutamyl-phosphate reductase [Melioribacteraceae bacterium]|nr:N-acetyl-gamma-glutamyl-phosphate reductase [Melioribacteraceae bacterium]
MIDVGIIGGTGYTGKKLLQILTNHPNVKNITVYGNASAGNTLLNLFPELLNTVNDSCVLSVDEITFNHDIYFVALPHGEALKYIPQLIERGKKVIDLGGDYRFDNVEEYEKWYNIKHTSSKLLGFKQYGLADYYKLDYNNTNFIANPGCYPTSVLLSALPFVENFNEYINTISTCAYSGTSGAGKSAKTEMLMSEMDGNVKAYNVNNHRHQPEIIQELNKAGLIADYSITTHLLPVAVGIYSTTTIKLNKSVLPESVNEVYNKKYLNSKFVRLRQIPPSLTWVVGTNYCDINISIKHNTVIITSAIDNLIKGASGQAIQNMNKMFNYDETSGILNNGVTQ